METSAMNLYQGKGAWTIKSAASLCVLWCIISSMAYAMDIISQISFLQFLCMGVLTGFLVFATLLYVEWLAIFHEGGPSKDNHFLALAAGMMGVIASAIFFIFSNWRMLPTENLWWMKILHYYIAWNNVVILLYLLLSAMLLWRHGVMRRGMVFAPLWYSVATAVGGWFLTKFSDSSVVYAYPWAWYAVSALVLAVQFFVAYRMRMMKIAGALVLFLYPFAWSIQMWWLKTSTIEGFFETGGDPYPLTWDYVSSLKHAILPSAIALACLAVYMFFMPKEHNPQEQQEVRHSDSIDIDLTYLESGVTTPFKEYLLQEPKKKKVDEVDLTMMEDAIKKAQDSSRPRR